MYRELGPDDHLRILGIEASALLRVHDLVAEEDSIVHRMPRERRDFLRAREREVMLAALDAVLDGSAASQR